MDGEGCSDLLNEFNVEGQEEEDSDLVATDGTLESDYLDDVMDDLEVVEDNMTSEVEHWKLRDDLVALQEL